LENHSDEILSSLRGAYDMHVHSAPDVLDRSGDDIEFAVMAKEHGMGGYVIKSHYVPTADRANLVNKMVLGVKIFGSLCLNNSVGGINPLAVDIAGRLGCKVVWFPTVDSLNESEKRGLQSKDKLPFWAKMQEELRRDGFQLKAVKVLDDNGKFTKDVFEVLYRIQKYKMILATGHLAPNESIALIKEAKEIGIDKIIVTHPEFPTTNFTLEEQKELAKESVFFERCYTTPATGKTTWDHVLKEVKLTGSERNILSTDLGQKGAIHPTEGLKEFIRFFLENGYKTEDVRNMTVLNQRELIG
jgi:hypothetical protein